MRRIIVSSTPERKTSRATRTRARGTLTREQKRLAKLGKVGMFDFEFTLIKDRKAPGRQSRVIKEVMIKTDSYDEAIEYARINTPAGHQGLIDGQSVVCKQSEV